MLLEKFGHINPKDSDTVIYFRTNRGQTVIHTNL